MSVASAFTLSHHLASALHLSSSSPKKEEVAYLRGKNEVGYTKTKDEGTRADLHHVKGDAGSSKEASAGNTTRVSKSVMATPIALKGLDFLRSKSAPPSPREQNTATPVHGDTEFVAVNNMDGAVAGLGGKADPSIPISSGEKIPSPEVSTDERSTLATPLPDNPGTKPTPPISRVESAPALEAILLDRKRRLIASTATSTGGNAISLPITQGAVDVRPRGTGVKGTMFKSSPLGGED
jgi:metal transporter CNNM